MAGIIDGIWSNVKSTAANYMSTDAGLRTSAPGEVDVRNAFPFANIIFSFVGRDSALALPCFLTSLSDNYNVTFNQSNAYGRTDPISIYDNTRRTMSFSLTLPSYDSSDANIKNKKINELIKNLYPTYEEVGQKNQVTGQKNRILSKSPLLRIKFANIITNADGIGLLGYITSFNVAHDVNNGFFMESGIISQPNLFTKTVTLSIGFQPLHEQPLGYTVKNEKEKWAGRSSKFPYKNSYSLEEGVTDALSAIGANIDLDILGG